MELATFEWLLTDAGQALLALASAAYAEEHDPVRRASVVRRAEPVGAPDGAAAAALTTAGLRVRGRAKLGPDAERLYLTPEALEQATRARVAAHRAARLAAAAPASVVDLGCGVGGDLLALARAGLLVAGVDLDPVRVAMARANLAALGLPGAVEVADATTLALDGFGAAFADPGRRTGRGRTFRVEDWQPPWPFVEGLLRRTAVVKVAPGLPHELVPDGVEAEWVSEDGEVKEAALWSGPLATVARRATVIGTGGLATLTDEDQDDEPPPVGPVATYLYEPDGAVIRAGLVAAVAAGVGGTLLDPHIAYVTSVAAYRTPFARGYEVLERLPYREKQLRAALQERGIGRLTIKKRGVDVTPEQLRPRLALHGDEEATVVLTRVAGVGTALLVRPL